MATIILSAVGQAIGGPIGQSIGAAVGSLIDNKVFGKSKGRSGPRLKELEIQTSSYGTQIPKILGKMRVAGSVIWASALKESSQKEGGGKGQPSYTSYSYSASFAVALSSGTIKHVGRIWADGNLVRGADGSFKIATGFRLYTGADDQQVDPLMAAAVGIDTCPAMRGISYVVFEDFALADFGNRLPQLTFEVIERDTPVAVHSIADAAAPGLILQNVTTGNTNFSVTGYALEGDSQADALAPLFDAMPISIRAQAAQLVITDPHAVTPATSPAIVAQANGKQLELSSKRAIESSLPTALQLRYYDTERDYQLGMQADNLLGTDGDSATIALPSSLTANRAKAIAQAKLLLLRGAAHTIEAHIIDSAHLIQLGDVIMLEDSKKHYRINRQEIFAGFTRIQASGTTNIPTLPAVNTDPGLHWIQPDYAIGPTQMLLLDLPAITREAGNKPLIAVAAAGTSPGWRGASVHVLEAGGYEAVGQITRPTTMGKLVTSLAYHPACYEDSKNTILIDVIHDQMSLPPGTGSAFDLSAPAIWVGGEILRYASAQKMGPRRYMISGLLRGQFATNPPATSHAVDTDIMVLERDSLFFLDSPYAEQSQVSIAALGPADTAPVVRNIAPEQLAIRPLAPCLGGARPNDDGSIMLEWRRRARIDDGWRDYVDQPVVEASESYTIGILHAGNIVSQHTSIQPSFVITPTQISQWPASGAITAEIRQLGTYSQSPAHVITLRP